MSALRGQLRTLAHDALVTAATLAGANVFLPRDWPTNSATMPNISVQTPDEQKQSVGRNGPPQFTTTVWLQLRCQVAGTDAGQVESDLETLADQAELVIMGLVIVAPQFVQQVRETQYKFEVSAEGALHTGEAILLFAVEYRERFDAVLSDTLGGLDVTVAQGPALAILPASGATAAGSAVLQFASPLPDAIAQRQLVWNRTTDGVLQLGSLVQSFDAVAGTVTLTKTAIGSGVGQGDEIEFTGPVLATLTIDIPS